MYTHNFQQNSYCKPCWELWVQKKGMEAKKSICERALVDLISDYKGQKSRFTGLRIGSIGKAMLLEKRSKN